jgi:hypothetical protein
MESQYKRNTLRHWYLGEYEWRGEKVLLAYGQFYNRPGFYEGMNGRTSIVQTVKINHEEKEFEIQTMNNLYHCSFDSCFFERQDDSPYKLPEYETIKAAYFKPVNTEELAKNDMVLVVADYNDYYFESLIYLNPDGSKGKYSGYPHIGMFTDTFLINGDREPYEYDEESEYIDIRYYVDEGSFEFYSLDTGGRNLWIENRGDSTLNIYGCGSKINLEPGKRILALKKNLSSN